MTDIPGTDKPEDSGIDEDTLAAEEGSTPSEEAASEKPASFEQQKELNEWKNRAAYLSAEIENMRKRFARERSDIVRLANEDLLHRLLPVVDNLELAVKAAREAESKVEDSIRQHPVFSNLLKGIDMTLKHFEQTLEQSGVQAMKSLGETFDPSRHEAIAQSQSGEHGDNVVTGEMQRGFMLNGRVIRPARVVVNKTDK